MITTTESTTRASAFPQDQSSSCSNINDNTSSSHSLRGRFKRFKNTCDKPKTLIILAVCATVVSVGLGFVGWGFAIPALTGVGICLGVGAFCLCMGGVVQSLRKDTDKSVETSPQTPDSLQNQFDNHTYEDEGILIVHPTTLTNRPSQPSISPGMNNPPHVNRDYLNLELNKFEIALDLYVCLRNIQLHKKNNTTFSPSLSFAGRKFTNEDLDANITASKGEILQHLIKVREILTYFINSTSQSPAVSDPFRLGQLHQCFDNITEISLLVIAHEKNNNTIEQENKSLETIKIDLVNIRSYILSISHF